MAAPKENLPDTMVSPETGEILRSDVRPFLVTYKGRSVTVRLPGYYPDEGDEGVHVGDDMDVTDAALRTLKEEVEGIPSPATIRRVREKLKLSQREAGRLLKVGENAFDKYERGLVEPSGPTSQLLRLPSPRTDRGIARDRLDRRVGRPVNNIVRSFRTIRLPTILWRRRSRRV
jgi:HTH-type transcriptional regulator/antitoxin MqsA